MEVWTTVYCGKPHRLSDGKPVGHNCRIIPPDGLKAEIEGNLELFIEALERRPWDIVVQTDPTHRVAS